jgi:hypothetical protein
MQYATCHQLPVQYKTICSVRTLPVLEILYVKIVAIFREKEYTCKGRFGHLCLSACTHHRPLQHLT